MYLCMYLYYLLRIHTSNISIFFGKGEGWEGEKEDGGGGVIE